MVEGVEVAVSSTSTVVEAGLIHLHPPDLTPNIVGELLLIGLVVSDVDVEGLIVRPIGQLGEVVGDAEGKNSGVGHIDGVGQSV